jgi:hypothetical protein
MKHTIMGGFILLHGFILLTFFDSAGICSELRTLELPSQKQNLYNRQQGETVQPKKQKVGPSVYKEVEQKVKTLSPNERKKASAVVLTRAFPLQGGTL